MQAHPEPLFLADDGTVNVTNAQLDLNVISISFLLSFSCG